MPEEVDVLSYVQSRFPVIRRGDAYNVHVHCCFHQEDQSKRGRLYINVDPRADTPGLFHCKVCDERGSLKKLKAFFGDVDDATPEDIDHETRRAIFEASTRYYFEKLAEHNEAIQWLNDRGLTMDTIVKFRLGYADGGLKSHLRGLGYSTKEIIATGLISESKETQRLEDSLQESVTIPYAVSGNVMMIRGRSLVTSDGATKYKTPFGAKSRLFNSDATWGVSELVITEGEFDAMLLTQMGFNAAAAPGSGSWQDSWDGYVADLKRIYVCFDPDSAGDIGASKLRERFGPRCKVLELPRGVAGMDGHDLTDWVIKDGHGEDDFRALMREASGGGLLMTVDECAEDEEALQNQVGLKLNQGDLDLAIRPGWLPGQVMVVLAKTGVGKTTWLLNTFQRMAMHQDQLETSFLFLSLEQTGAEYWSRAKKIYQFYSPLHEFEDAKKFWRPKILVTEKNRLTEDDVNLALDNYEERMGKLPEVVAVDYLGYWAQSFKGDRYARTGDAIMSLKAIAKERKIRIVTPHQVGRNARNGEEFDSDAARDSGVVEETADFLFMLNAVDPEKDPNYLPGQVDLKIGKSRHGGRGEKFSYIFAPITLVLLPTDIHAEADPLRMRAAEERFARSSNLGVTYDEVLTMHRRLYRKYGE